VRQVDHQPDRVVGHTPVGGARDGRDQDTAFGGCADVHSVVWVPETRPTSCDLVVFVEEAAEPIASADVGDLGGVLVGECALGSLWGSNIGSWV
jgi:hypothetical protein